MKLSKQNLDKLGDKEEKCDEIWICIMRIKNQINVEKLICYFRKIYYKIL